MVARVEQDATANAVADQANRFWALVRASGVDRRATQRRDATAELDAWITTAKAYDAPAIATFASGLDSDAAAVRSTLTEPWSSGQAEGQINRLKLIKRQSYGRASKAGFYAWRERAPSARQVADSALLARVQDVHAASRDTYEAPRSMAPCRPGASDTGASASPG